MAGCVNITSGDGGTRTAVGESRKRNNLLKAKTIKSRNLLASLVLILVLGLGGGSAWALDWFVDIVDGEYPDSEVGMWTNVVCDSKDRPRCSYYEGDDNCLKYAAWNGTSWDCEVVDEGGPTDPFSVGRYNCLAIDSQDRCHISYRDRNKFRLKYAVQNGMGGWDIQVVDDPNVTDPVGNGRVGVGRYTSIDLDSNEYPHISYTDLDNGCLKYARWNGSSWEVENVYCTSIPLTISGTSIQIDSNDHPHIAFGDRSIENGGMVARWNGSTWTFVNIKYSMEISTYMAIDANDDLHITIRGCYYIRTKGAEWITEWIPIASPGGSSIRLDKNGYPRICHTGSNNDIWYLYYTGTEWIDQRVDDSPEVGEERCIGLDSKGIPYITYFAQRYYDKQQIRIASIIPPKPDSDDDGDVDWSDLKAVVDDWLWSGHPGDSPGDIICDGIVKLDDFAWLAALWFEGCSFRAYNPSPADFAEDVDPNAVLCWTPGISAAAHDVYFGTHFNDVSDANASSSEYKGRQNLDANMYDPCGLLELGTTYYWRIDEVNGPNTWKRDIWSFTAVDCIVVDDMESYNTFDNLIDDTWLGYWWNMTGSWTELWIDPCEPVHAGRQSMKYDYDTGGGGWGDLHYYSEIERTYSASQDWTVSGAEALTLYFYGDPDNAAGDAEQMYVGLEDSRGMGSYADVKYADMNDITEPDWQEWNIALSDFNDVNLACVEKVYIGFGDRGNLNPGGTPGGSGVVYFDDIRLCAK